MQIFISRNGEQIGAWSEAEVRQYYLAGNLVATDHYWREGMAQWDTLGNLLAPPVPAPPAASTPASVPPPVPAHLLRDKRQGMSHWAWIVPLALAVVIAIAFGVSNQEQTSTGGKLSAIVAALIVLSAVAFPLSFIFPRAARLAARCGIIVFIGILAFVGRQHRATQSWVAEIKNFSAQQQQAERQQIAKSGYAKIDTQKINAELQKLQDMTKGQSPSDQKMSQATIKMMKDIATRTEACRTAEKPMLELGLAPSKMTSLDELEKRRMAVQAVQQPVSDLVAYLKNIDSTIRADLISRGVGGAAADRYVQGFEQSGKAQSLQTYWQQEASISADLLANLDILKANWGQWHVDEGKLIISNHDALASYKANLVKLNADIAVQKTAQKSLLTPPQ